MKCFFKFSFIALALVVSAAGAAPAAHAANCTLESDVGSACSVGGASGTCSGNERDGYSCNTTGASGSTSFSQAAQQAAAGTPTNPTLGGSASDQFGGIMTWIMSLFAWLAGVAAMTLDYAAYYTVVTMGNYIHDLAAVGVTWRILRDIGNIMLIFGFLSVGLTTILNVDWYGFSTKMLPMLLVSAVFLNFSLFLTEAVIDTGNLFATQFVTQINGGEMPTRASLSRLTASNEGISNKIMAQLGFQTIYNPNTNDLKGSSSWLIGFMGVILFIVTAFVMFSLAFILIARFVILLFLIIVSPIGWAALAIPKLRKLADMWWGELFEQTLTAPVLLLALYVALAVITDAQFLTGFNSSSGAWLGFVENGNLPGFVSILLSFFVAMGLLFGVVIFSKKLSAFGGDWATKTAGKLTFGLTAAGLRTTAGWGLNSAARRFRSAKIGGVRLAAIPVFGRSVAGALDRGAASSFDIRGIKTFGGLKGGMGVEAGEAQKGGYTQQLKEAIEGREKYAATLEMSKGEKELVKTEEDLIKALEATEQTIKAENEAQMRALQTRQTAAMRPLNADVEARRKALRAAEASGVGVDAAQLALNNALLGAQQRRDEQNREREALKRNHDKRVNDNTAKINESKTKVANLKQSPQLEYARNIQLGPGKFLYRNVKAAENIKKNAGKSKEQREVEGVLELAKKYAAAGSAPAAPAPAAPPAGGGASAP